MKPDTTEDRFAALIAEHGIEFTEEQRTAIERFIEDESQGAYQMGLRRVLLERDGR